MNILKKMIKNIFNKQNNEEEKITQKEYIINLGDKYRIRKVSYSNSSETYFFEKCEITNSGKILWNNVCKYDPIYNHWLNRNYVLSRNEMIALFSKIFRDEYENKNGYSLDTDKAGFKILDLVEALKCCLEKWDNDPLYKDTKAVKLREFIEIIDNTINNC